MNQQRGSHEGTFSAYRRHVSAQIFWDTRVGNHYPKEYRDMETGIVTAIED